MKNALALVAALVGQTLRSETVMATARKKVAARIIALSRAHDVLVPDRVKIASITTILNDLLVAIDPEQVQIRLND